MINSPIPLEFSPYIKFIDRIHNHLRDVKISYTTLTN
jgi:hypothetical protein